MEENNYFKSLPIEIKVIFDEIGYFPKNEREADFVLKSYYNLDSRQPFTINLKYPIIDKKHEAVTQIYVDVNYPFSAFVPNIWEQLDFGTRLKCIVFAYDCLVNKSKLLMDNKPSLCFFLDDLMLDICKALGAYSLIDNKIYISPLYIRTCNNGLNILQNIAHELTHSKQTKQFEYKKPKNLYELSNIVHRSCDFVSYIGFVTLLKEKNKSKLNKFFTAKEYADFYKIVTKNDWRILTDFIFYFNRPIEVGAYSVGNKMYDKIEKDLSLRYEFYANDKINAQKNILNKLKENGFEFSSEELENLQKLEFILTRYYDDSFISLEDKDEIFVKGLRFVYDVYKTKKVENEFDAVDFKKFAKEKLKQQQEELQFENHE